MFLIQNSNILKQLRKIQCGIPVIDFTMKFNIKKYQKIPVNIPVIKRENTKLEVKPK
jgi:hypothetical protein